MRTAKRLCPRASSTVGIRPPAEARPPHPWGLAAVAGLVLLALTMPSLAAEATYPFEGTWVRADRACTPTTVRERTYTAKEVTSPRGKCVIRRIASATGVFELLEECRRNDKPMTVTETIRLPSPDAMILKRQLSRLKIPRQVRYVRCGPAAPPPPVATPGRAGRTPLPPADPKGRDHEKEP